MVYNLYPWEPQKLFSLYFRLSTRFYLIIAMHWYGLSIICPNKEQVTASNYYLTASYSNRLVRDCQELAVYNLCNFFGVCPSHESRYFWLRRTICREAGRIKPRETIYQNRRNLKSSQCWRQFQGFTWYCFF